jgi:hypothetical protein
MKSLNPKEVKNRIVFSPVSLFRLEDKPGIVSLFTLKPASVSFLSLF